MPRRFRHPFLKHAFLDALEATGCVGGDSGWIPAHLVIRDSPSGKLVAAVPQYLKTHSWGEFVFDWSWAQSYQRSGLEYYPKQLSAIPFTPVTGPRLLLSGADDAQVELREQLAALLLESARHAAASGAHVNFTLDQDQAVLERAGFMRRHDCRFLWHNRGYRSFDDFLATFRADKRKRRERAASGSWRGVSYAAGSENRVRSGARFLLRTHVPAARQRALPEPGVPRTRRAHARHHRVDLAEQAGVPIAAAIFFHGGGRLYGRYWGALERVDCLHFEACYYQGIDYCIARGIEAFDPGTQGEHKLARGFEPTLTHSAHWLAHPGFATAVGRYLERERAAVAEYIAAAALHLPFQRGPSP
jgi:hypothetical protein